jgi:hypothetical protein
MQKSELVQSASASASVFVFVSSLTTLLTSLRQVKKTTSHPLRSNGSCTEFMPQERLFQNVDYKLLETQG